MRTHPTQNTKSKFPLWNSEKHESHEIAEKLSDEFRRVPRYRVAGIARLLTFDELYSKRNS